VINLSPNLIEQTRFNARSLVWQRGAQLRADTLDEGKGVLPLKLVNYTNSTVPITLVKRLLSYAVGESTEDNLCWILDKLYSDPDTILYVVTDNDDISLGIVGLKKTANHAEILHIAVDEQKRKQGIGRRIIDELLELEKPAKLIAMTDLEAVDFYRKYGFSMYSLGEKYPGVERFLCKLNWSP
jgi:GNAT superfamily N-acetyltransferase